MEITDSGMTTEVNPVPLKALAPIEVTVLVMVTEVKLLKPLKAPSPMDGLPMVTVVNGVPVKMPSPMVVTESGISTELNCVLAKAPLLMMVTELGISTEINPVLKKASSPIVV